MGRRFGETCALDSGCLSLDRSPGAVRSEMEKILEKRKQKLSVENKDSPFAIESSTSMAFES